MSEDEYEHLRSQAIFIGIVSIIIATILIPNIVGFLSGFYLPPSELNLVIAIFVILRLQGIVRTIVDFDSHAVPLKRTRLALVVLYLTYLAVYAYEFLNAYNWTQSYTSTGKSGQILSSLFELIVGKVIVQTILVGGLGGLVISMVADRKVHNKRIDTINHEEKKKRYREEIRKIREAVIKSNPKAPSGPKSKS